MKNRDLTTEPLPAPNSVELAALLNDLALDPDTRATIERLLAVTLALERERAGRDGK